jgi:hypothetical protein
MKCRENKKHKNNSEGVEYKKYEKESIKFILEI